MDQSPCLEPLTRAKRGNGLARTLLRSYRGRTISDRKPRVLYVQKIIPAVPIVTFALLFG